VTSSQTAVAERIVDHVASVSWMAALPEDEREQTIAQVDAIVSAGETPPQLPVHFVLGLTQLL
jgi:hypothetical protein